MNFVRQTGCSAAWLARHVRDVEAGGSNPPNPTIMQLSDLQAAMAATYGDRDAERGVSASVAWLVEEVGELAQALRKGTPAQQRHEFADVLAWVASLANQVGIDLDAAVQASYGSGCPKCSAVPCACP
jgi:NTP pyrophosphatase (non-canonical NTP hydrolase)